MYRRQHQRSSQFRLCALAPRHYPIVASSRWRRNVSFSGEEALCIRHCGRTCQPGLSCRAMRSQRYARPIRIRDQERRFRAIQKDTGRANRPSGRHDVLRFNADRGAGGNAQVAWVDDSVTELHPRRLHRQKRPVVRRLVSLDVGANRISCTASSKSCRAASNLSFTGEGERPGAKRLR